MTSRSRAIWAAWLVGVLASFGYLEYEAYVNRRHLTLSRWLAWHMGIEPRHRHAHLSTVLFALGWAVLTVHVARIRAAESS